MHTPSILVSALALALAQAAAAAPSSVLHRRQANAECTNVQVFVARGSLEEIPGRQGKLVDAVCGGMPAGTTCGSTDIQYPATFDAYCKSVGSGVSFALRAVEAYAAACPDSKMVLTGYSQGAHLMGDATTAPLAAAAAKKVMAVTLFGDVRHTANQTYNLGEGAGKSGILPRKGAQLTGLNVHSDKIHSWCNGQDPVCSSGNDLDQHLTYFDQFTPDAAAFIKSKL
ncbi:carbohydrate esterase family 5 protein [Apiospora saccharicola]|uniref:Carbohydrate esterase family 5 protein n=1 Tax=Apiospora saccharicola TaxID=335842 RepID=A0ABR1U1Y7_9PEZI